MHNKKLGFLEAFSIGVGGMVGGGIFAVLGLTIDLAKGAAPIAFLIAGLIALITAYSYAKLSVKYNATLLFATATFYRLYARNRKIHPLMFNSLRMVIAGAEKLPKEIAELFKSRFGKTILELGGNNALIVDETANLDLVIPAVV